MATAARGFCVGTADLVPGVSGATVALVLGIYERLVAAIRGFDRRLAIRLLRFDLPAAARHVDAGFLAPLAAGAALAAVVLTRLIPLPSLMESHEVEVRSFFFGLVAAALVLLFREARGPDALRRPDLAAAGGGLAAGWGIAVAVPAATPDSAWFVFSAGACAAAAMILPGVSGAYVLVLLKKYTYVLAALGRFDVAILVPFGLGVVVGLALTSRAIVWLMGRFRRPTLFGLAGLVTGSLWALWPYRVSVGERTAPVWPESPDLAGVLSAAAGLGVVGAFHLAARRRIRPPGHTDPDPPSRP